MESQTPQNRARIRELLRSYAQSGDCFGIGETIAEVPVADRLHAFSFAIYHAARGNHRELCNILVKRAHASSHAALVAQIAFGAARAGHTQLLRETLLELSSKIVPDECNFAETLAYRAGCGNYSDVIRELFDPQCHYAPRSTTGIGARLSTRAQWLCIAQGAARRAHVALFMRCLRDELKPALAPGEVVGTLKCAMRGGSKQIIRAILDVATTVCASAQTWRDIMEMTIARADEEMRDYVFSMVPENIDIVVQQIAPFTHQVIITK